jgi:4-hydroxy-tetrahydrodipicolinate reductase
MKISLLGYGKMNQMIEQLAIKQGHQIVMKVSKHLGTAIQQQGFLELADVCIDFSHEACVFEHIQLCGKHQKNLIIGTTGWESRLKEAQALVHQFQIGCLYAPNFAIGVHLFMKLVSYAAQLFDPFSEYDIAAWESHHRQKKDRPSGTAKALSQAILQSMPRIKSIEFTSLRSGFDPGTHSISFDSPHDKLTLVHESRNRESFARGALKAAEWIQNKQGFFTLEEMLTWN